MNFGKLEVRYEIIMKSENDYRVYDNISRNWVSFLIEGKKVISFSSLNEAMDNANHANLL